MKNGFRSLFFSFSDPRVINHSGGQGETTEKQQRLERETEKEREKRKEKKRITISFYGCHGCCCMRPDNSLA